MIELAPRHKFGLPLHNPVLIASGFGGYGDAYHALIDLSAFGAIVTNPITLRPRRGPVPPRLAETRAGFILNTGQQNPGVRQVIQRYRKIWSRRKPPIIAHLPADVPDDLARTARALAGTDAIAAIELEIPLGALPVEVRRWVEAVRSECPLPLLVKLPLFWAVELAEVAADTTADALVIAGAPAGAAPAAPQSQGEMVRGGWYGPGLHSLVVEIIQTIRPLVDLPLVASGGIHTATEAQTCLQMGAAAVQIDSLLFIDPRAAYDIARAHQPG